MPDPLKESWKPLILIVEDDRPNAEVLELLITHETPYCARTVSSGIEALQEVQQRTPQLLLLDVVLPGMSGMELYERVRTIPGCERVPTLFLTASVHHQAQLEARHLAVLAKPYDLAHLLAVLQTLLDPRSLGSAALVGRRCPGTQTPNTTP